MLALGSSMQFSHRVLSTAWVCPRDRILANSCIWVQLFLGEPEWHSSSDPWWGWLSNLPSSTGGELAEIRSPLRCWVSSRGDRWTQGVVIFKNGTPWVWGMCVKQDSTPNHFFYYPIPHPTHMLMGHLNGHYLLSGYPGSITNTITARLLVFCSQLIPHCLEQCLSYSWHWDAS